MLAGREWDGSGSYWLSIEKSECVLPTEAEIHLYISPLPTDSNRKRRSGFGFLDLGESLFRGREGGASWREETTNPDTSSLRCISSLPFGCSERRERRGGKKKKERNTLGLEMQSAATAASAANARLDL